MQVELNDDQVAWIMLLLGYAAGAIYDKEGRSDFAKAAAKASFEIGRTIEKARHKATAPCRDSSSEE